MPTEEYLKSKRNAEQARAWNKDSPTYSDVPDLRKKILYFGLILLIFALIALCVVMPLIQLIDGSLPFPY